MQKISRREFAKRAGVGAASLAVPGLAVAAQTPDELVQTVERGLSRPLSEEARILARKAIENSLAASQARMKFKLTDCSEPCTIFPVSPAERVNP